MRFLTFPVGVWKSLCNRTIGLIPDTNTGLLAIATALNEYPTWLRQLDGGKTPSFQKKIWFCKAHLWKRAQITLCSPSVRETILASDDKSRSWYDSTLLSLFLLTGTGTWVPVWITKSTYSSSIDTQPAGCMGHWSLAAQSPTLWRKTSPNLQDPVQFTLGRKWHKSLIGTMSWKLGFASGFSFSSLLLSFFSLLFVSMCFSLCLRMILHNLACLSFSKQIRSYSLDLLENRTPRTNCILCNLVDMTVWNGLPLKKRTRNFIWITMCLRFAHHHTAQRSGTQLFPNLHPDVLIILIYRCTIIFMTINQRLQLIHRRLTITKNSWFVYVWQSQ